MTLLASTLAQLFCQIGRLEHLTVQRRYMFTVVSTTSVKCSVPMNCLLCNVMCRCSLSESGLKCACATHNKSARHENPNESVGEVCTCLCSSPLLTEHHGSSKSASFVFRALLSSSRGCQLGHSRPHHSTPVLDSKHWASVDDSAFSCSGLGALGVLLPPQATLLAAHLSH